jgi:hypothetical protein
VKGRYNKKKFIVKVVVTTGPVKGKQQEKTFIVKVLVIAWHSEISDCVLSPQAYVH